MEPLWSINAYAGYILAMFYPLSPSIQFLAKKPWVFTDKDIPDDQPPSWLFGVAWTLIFASMSAGWITLILLVIPNGTYDGLYIAAYCLFALYALLTKLWVVVAGDLNSPKWANFIVYLIIVNTLALGVILTFGAVLDQTQWAALPAGLTVFPLVWGFLALYLNTQYVAKKKSMVEFYEDKKADDVAFTEPPRVVPGAVPVTQPESAPAASKIGAFFVPRVAKNKVY